ncbi:MAG TPA: DUF4424 family protein [Planctomycetota bacterium]|nr:DUF4424 family protein [Planctomycetota bacterium]
MRTRLACAATALALAASTALWADVATPRPQWTTVRMEAEEVNITLGEQKVQVDAVFHMHNQGAASTVAMGYPLGAFETALNDFAVTAGGQPVKAIRTQAGGAQSGPGRGGMVIRGGGGKPGGVANEPYRFEGPYKEWKVFDVPFAADEKKVVRVTYWVEPAKVKDAQAGTLLTYSYTMKTGATWKGKIDEAKISVKLSGIAASRLVRVLPAGSQRSASGTTLAWTLKDFKPTENIEITFRPTAATTAAR